MAYIVVRGWNSERNLKVGTQQFYRAWRILEVLVGCYLLTFFDRLRKRRYSLRHTDLLQKLNFWYNGLHHTSSFPEAKKQRYNVFSQRDNLEF